MAWIICFATKKGVLQIGCLLYGADDQVILLLSRQRYPVTVSVSKKSILAELLKQIAEHSCPENMHNYQRFHKETLADPMGLKTAIVRKISNEVYRQVKNWSANDLLDCCDFLLASDRRYMRFVGFDWAQKIPSDYRKSDLSRFKRWLDQYVDNWGACDHLCCGPLGLLLQKYPELVSRTHSWTRSRNRWVRRAAAVCLIVSLRDRRVLDEAFRVADELLLDEDDLVQKGYGWMLKEASNEFRREVFEFVMARKDRMPRTALRYAIEKMPATMRKKAMT